METQKEQIDNTVERNANMNFFFVHYCKLAKIHFAA